MSNKTIVQRMFDEIINKGDVDLVDELFDPAFVTETPQGTFDREGFKQYVLGWRAGFPDVRCEVTDVVEEGDRIAWAVRATGTHTGDFMGIPATGRSIDIQGIDIMRFDGAGLVCEHWGVTDTMAMMQQLGVVPDGP